MTTNNTTDSKQQQGEARPPCDYRNKECAAYGYTIGSRWVCTKHVCEQLQQCWLNGRTPRASLAAVEGDERCEVSYTGRHRIDAPYCKDCGRVFTPPAESEYHEGFDDAARVSRVLNAGVLSPLPAEPPPSDAKFVPPAEDALHIAICQAVQEHHGPSANAILRTALNDYKPTQLTRTELIRVQQRSGADEVTAVMVSPAEPRQEGEQEKQK